MIAWDLETTSLNTNEARIWEFATYPGGTTFVDPFVEIPEKIIELCHLDAQKLDAIRHAPRWHEIKHELINQLIDADAIVTQNGPRYDVPVLCNSHHGVIPEALPPVFDVRVLALEAWPNLPNHKLVTLAEHVGLGDIEDLQQCAHAADFDCRMTLDVFNKLPKKWINDLDRLIKFQKRAQERQELDWEEYGVTPEDGPRFLWFRTCRKCMGDGCDVCKKMGILHHSSKRRGQTVDVGFLKWLKKLPDRPKAFKGE